MALKKLPKSDHNGKVISRNAIDEKWQETAGSGRPRRGQGQSIYVPMALVEKVKKMIKEHKEKDEEL